jgi:tetratricopeptide (TPR) repeat protein
MDPIDQLNNLDVQDSMARTCEVILAALEEVECAGADKAMHILDLIEKKIEEAEEYFWRPLDDPSIYERISKVFEGIGQNERCERYLCKMKEHEANIWEFRGRVQNFFGNNRLAVRYYEKALECDADNELAITGLEKAKKRLAKADDEIAKAKRAIDRKPGVMNNHVKLGMALADKGDVAGAIREFENVLTKEPDNIDALCKKAHMLESQGKYEESIPLLKKAQEIKPNSLAAKRGLGYADYFLENKEEIYNNNNEED